MASKAKFHVYMDKSKGFRFNLKAANGEIIAQGESYKTKPGCLKGIERLKKYAAIAEVVDDIKEKK